MQKQRPYRPWTTCPECGRRYRSSVVTGMFQMCFTCILWLKDKKTEE